MGNSISLDIVENGGQSAVLVQRRLNSNADGSSGGAGAGAGAPRQHGQHGQLLSPASSEGSREFQSRSESRSSGEDVNVDGDVNVNVDTSADPNADTSAVRGAKLRQCWICYGEEDERGQSAAQLAAAWVSPCLCRGTTKWVHQACLLEWIDSQMGMGVGAEGQEVREPRARPYGSVPLVLQSAQLACPQCHAPYRIAQQHALPRALLRLVDRLVAAQERALIWATLGLGAAALYSVCLSYGLWTGWVLGGEAFGLVVRGCVAGLGAGGVGAGGGWARVQLGLGMLLAPGLALSLSFPRFQSLYVLVPALVWRPGLPVRLGQPRVVLLVLPLLWLVHERVLDGFLCEGGDARLGQEGVSGTSPITDITDSTDTTDTTDSSPSTASTDTTDTPSPTTVRISILATASSLLFPSVAALAGVALGAVLPRAWGAALQRAPLHRSLLGAGLLLLLRDVTRVLYWYQNVRLRRFRRVLGQAEPAQ